jgi:hypothetical protein
MPNADLAFGIGAVRSRDRPLRSARASTLHGARDAQRRVSEENRLVRCGRPMRMETGGATNVGGQNALGCQPQIVRPLSQHPGRAPLKTQHRAAERALRSTRPHPRRRRGIRMKRGDADGAAQRSVSGGACNAASLASSRSRAAAAGTPNPDSIPNSASRRSSSASHAFATASGVSADSAASRPSKRRDASSARAAIGRPP